jgi:hypothetical protein
VLFNEWLESVLLEVVHVAGGSEDCAKCEGEDGGAHDESAVSKKECMWWRWRETGEQSEVLYQSRNVAGRIVVSIEL